MNNSFLIPLIVLAILMLAPLYRVVRGPTVYDRVIAAGLMGTDGILMLVLLGFFYDRIDMFIDISIVYALLNFVGVIAAGKYLDRRQEEERK